MYVFDSAQSYIPNNTEVLPDYQIKFKGIWNALFWKVEKL